MTMDIGSITWYARYADIFHEKRNAIIIHERALWQVWQWTLAKGMCE